MVVASGLWGVLNHREIWCIVVVSIHLMLLYAAMNPACAFLNTTLEDSENTELTATFGYLNQSLMNIFSIVGSFLAPSLERILGTQLLITIAGLLHAGLYVGVVVLNWWCIVTGSILSGIGMGLIWVIIPSFVTKISKHQNIERNMTYHLFLFTFNGVTGNLINFLCLDESSTITAESRLVYFTTCTAVTVVSSIASYLTLALFPAPNTHSSKSLPKTSDSDPSTNDDDDDEGVLDDAVPLVRDNGDSDSTPTSPPPYRKPSSRALPGSRLGQWWAFLADPVIISTCLVNVYYGFIITLVVVVPTCIGNTYEDRYLIPLMGMVVGITRVLVSGVWDKTARIIGYRPLNLLFTVANVTWIALTFGVFTDESAHEPVRHGHVPLVEMSGTYLTYVQGALTGLILTAMNIICQVSIGKVSTDANSMKGFSSSVLFAFTMVIYSISAAVTMAMVPYIGLYGYLFFMFIFLLLNHLSLSVHLLGFVRY